MSKACLGFTHDLTLNISMNTIDPQSYVGTVEYPENLKHKIAVNIELMKGKCLVNCKILRLLLGFHFPLKSESNFSEQILNSLWGRQINPCTRQT